MLKETQQREVIRLFHASKNNQSVTIAKELNLSVYWVDEFLTRYLREKFEKSISKRETESEPKFIIIPSKMNDL